MGPDHPRRGRERQLMRAASFCAVAMLAGCATEPAFTQPPTQLVVRVQVTGVVTGTQLLARPADPSHLCTLPSRARMVTATGPAPGPDEPANAVFGYSVNFGPDFPRDTDFVESGPFPGAAYYGPQQRFTLEIFAQPGQEATAGPVLLGRRFRITVAAGGAVYARDVGEEELPAAGSVTIDPDMRGGRFRVRGLVQQLHHNRAPDSEAINVSGSWRCPAA